MPVFRAIAVAVALVVSVSAVAADPELLRKRFTERFHGHYEPRRCGLNCLGFIQAIHRETGDAGSLHLVEVVNRGLGVFGMVNAEAARGSRFHRPASVEANWYHHVFVVDDRGLVYDFDFSAEPRVVPIEEYIETMFLDEPECEKPVSGEFCGGRENKLRDYELTVTNGNDVVANRSSRSRKVRLGDVLKDWRVLLSGPGAIDCATEIQRLPE